MPKIIVTAPFKFAHFGYQVEEFEPSDEPRETTQEVVDVLKDEGFFTVCPSEADTSDPAPEETPAAATKTAKKPNKA